MADERSEKERLRGEGYGKLFSKKWWENFFYYYRKALIVAVFILIVAAVTIHEAVTKVKPDSIVTYIGYHNFSTEQLVNLQDNLIKLSSDANGDKKVHVTLNRDTLDISKAGSDQNAANMMESINLNLAVGDQVIYFMDRPCLNYYAGLTNNYFVDVKELAKKCNVPQNKIITLNGHTVGIDITNSDLLKASKITVRKYSENHKDNDVYMVIRKRRNVEKTDKKKASIYDNSISMANKIMTSIK